MMLSNVQFMDGAMPTAAFTTILADAGSVTLGVIVALAVIVGVIVLFTQLGALTTELSRLRGELARRQSETPRAQSESVRPPADAPRAAEEMIQLKQALTRLEATLGQAQSDDTANKAQLLRLQEELARSQGEIQKLSNVPRPAAATKSARPATSPAVQGGLADTKLVAVITAAAMAYLGKRVAVRRITFINQNTVSGWAEAGRLSIHTSHNVRRN
jgi:hypothetical protein